MVRPRALLLTDREGEIMAVLWKLGSASAEEVRGRLSGNPHDSTVRTLLRVLVGKGHVVVEGKSRPAIYRPAVRKRIMQKKVLRDLLQKFFGGSAEQLVVHLLDDRRLSPEQLKKLEEEYRRGPSEEKQDE